MKPSETNLRLVFSLLTFSLAAGLTGCGGSAYVPAASTVSSLKMAGEVHGGQQPVSGSKIYLFGIAGYQGSASNSLLSGSGVTVDSSGNGYVSTDANGNFTITGDYTCPSYNTAVDTYLLASGGNPGLGSGTNNSAIMLMAALGPCSGLTNVSFVNINEVSTAAMVAALQQFMTDGLHVSSPPNQIGIENAFSTVPNLVDLASGFALSSTATGQGVAPQATLNTLGNILAACINTASPGSSTCTSLFQAVTPSGGTAPTDTIGAMLAIAHNPGYNVSNTFKIGSSTPPFAPALSVAPNDFTLGITYSGGGLVQPGSLAVDNSGNIFTTNCATCAGTTGTDSIIGYSANGTVLTGAGYTAGIHKPTALALDLYDNIWSTNLATGSTPDQVNRTDSSGNQLSGFPLSDPTINDPVAIEVTGNYQAWVASKGNNTVVEVYGPGTITTSVTQSGFTAPSGIGIDGFGNVYASGSGSNNILKLSSTGTVLSSGYTGAGISSPVGIAVDGGQHVWTVDSGKGDVSEIFGYDGTATSGTTGYTGINTATVVTIAGDGTAWVANCRASCTGSGSTSADNIVHLSTTGASLAVSDGFQNSSLSDPAATVIDPAGNLWIANTKGASLTELVGVAAPVIPNLTYETSNNLLPAAQLLLNPGFELAGTGSYIPDWTLNAITGGTGIAYTEGGGHTGANKFTEYSGNAFSADEYQTIAVANGNYLVSCWATGSGGQTTASITANGYNTAGSSLSTNLLSPAVNGNWQLYSIPDVPVSNGSLTINLDSSSTSGGQYLSWDDCSVTKQ
jgi:hypothetical protein